MSARYKKIQILWRGGKSTKEGKWVRVGENRKRKEVDV